MNPITIAVRKIHCIAGTAGLGADEPYIIVFAANMTQTPPDVEATLYGPWGDVNEGETHSTVPIPPNIPPNVLDAIPVVWRRNCWGPSGGATTINKPSDAIILVGMMENDDGQPSSVRVVCQSFLFASVLATFNSGMSRSDIVAKLIKDMNDTLDTSSRGFPNSDDRLGSAQELVLTESDLNAASRGSLSKSFRFEGDGGKYDVFLDLKKG